MLQFILTALKWVNRNTTRMIRDAENQGPLNNLIRLQGQAKWILKNKLDTPLFSLILLGYLGYFTLYKAFSFIFVFILMFLPDTKSLGLFAEVVLPCKLASCFWYFIIIFSFFNSCFQNMSLEVFLCITTSPQFLSQCLVVLVYSHGSSVLALCEDLRCRISENAFSGK